MRRFSLCLVCWDLWIRADSSTRVFTAVPPPLRPSEVGVMTGSKQSLFGLLCAAALVSLPTLQAANTSQDVSFVAIAPRHSQSVADERSLSSAGIGGPRANVDQITLGGLATAATAASGADSLGISAGPDNGRWLWPTPSKLITSGFGYRSDPFNGGSAFHSGIDFGDPCGTPVGATRPGKVTFAGPAGGYGNRVVIDHGEGITSSYNHLQQITVLIGDEVTQSNAVGLVGTTGRSTGCHLHFEIMVNGGFTDPMPYLTGNPSANPTTFGNGNVAEAPITGLGTNTAPPSTSLQPAVDPCGISNDPADSMDSGGLIPIAGTPSASAACPSPSVTPTPSSSSSPTPSSSGSTPAPSTPAPSTPQLATPGYPSDSSTPQPSTSSSPSQPQPEAPPSGSDTVPPATTEVPSATASTPASSSVVTTPQVPVSSETMVETSPTEAWGSETPPGDGASI